MFDQPGDAVIGAIDIKSETSNAFGADVRGAARNLFRLDPAALETLIFALVLHNLAHDGRAQTPAGPADAIARVAHAKLQAHKRKGPANSGRAVCKMWPSYFGVQPGQKAVTSLCTRGTL